MTKQNQLYISKAEDFLPKLDSQSIQMIYIDPPYNSYIFNGKIWKIVSFNYS